MRYKYVKEHNNYDLTLGKEYRGYRYNDDWLLINDDNNNETLYRAEYFEKVEMICGICSKAVNPLDAHMGRIKGELIAAHIDCWNEK